MDDLTLIRKEIMFDIAGYWQRIRVARLRFASLPTVNSWKERRKARAIKQELVAEIAHAQRLVGYATDAFAEIQKEGSTPQ